MARTATLTVSLSTNPQTSHIGRYFADLRVNGRQTTRVGTAEMIRDFINKAHFAASAYDVTLEVEDKTFKSEFTQEGGLIGTPFAS